MRRYEPLVLAVAIKVLNDRHAAEDAAQNAFVSAYENLGRLRKASAFAAWVVKIARRQAIGLARRAPRVAPLDSAEETRLQTVEWSAGYRVTEASGCNPEVTEERTSGGDAEVFRRSFRAGDRRDGRAIRGNSDQAAFAGPRTPANAIEGVLSDGIARRYGTKTGSVGRPDRVGVFRGRSGGQEDRGKPPLLRKLASTGV